MNIELNKEDSSEREDWRQTRLSRLILWSDVHSFITLVLVKSSFGLGTFVFGTSLFNQIGDFGISKLTHEPEVKERTGITTTRWWVKTKRCVIVMSWELFVLSCCLLSLLKFCPWLLLIFGSLEGSWHWKWSGDGEHAPRTNKEVD